MTWRQIEISSDCADLFAEAFPRAYRFLVDENLGPELVPVLRRLGYNATALKPNNRSDEDVVAAEWREQRILLTQERGLLHDRLPATKDKALIDSLVRALPLVWKRREFWTGVKIVVGENGKLRVICHSHDTGAYEIMCFKLRMVGPPLIWIV